MYDGNIPGLVSFLKEYGAECPQYHNAADFGSNETCFLVCVFSSVKFCVCDAAVPQC